MSSVTSPSVPSLSRPSTPLKGPTRSTDALGRIRRGSGRPLTAEQREGVTRGIRTAMQAGLNAARGETRSRTTRTRDAITREGQLTGGPLSARVRQGASGRAARNTLADVARNINARRSQDTTPRRSTRARITGGEAQQQPRGGRVNLRPTGIGNVRGSGGRVRLRPTGIGNVRSQAGRQTGIGNVTGRAVRRRTNVRLVG
jgi:hypothetical protein